MEYTKLIGKTIVSVKQKKLVGHDDDGFLEMEFSDGTKATIVSFYLDYTGHSQDEYPTSVFVTERYDGKLEDIN